MAIELKERLAVSDFFSHVAEKFPGLGLVNVQVKDKEEHVSLLAVRLFPTKLKSIGKLFISESCKILGDMGVRYTITIKNNMDTPQILDTHVSIELEKYQDAHLAQMDGRELEHATRRAQEFTNISEYPLQGQTLTDENPFLAWINK